MKQSALLLLLTFVCSRLVLGDVDPQSTNKIEVTSDKTAVVSTHAARPAVTDQKKPMWKLISRTAVASTCFALSLLGGYIVLKKVSGQPQVSYVTPDGKENARKARLFTCGSVGVISLLLAAGGFKLLPSALRDLKEALRK